MTINTALATVDEMKPNMMSTQLKLQFLTEIEQLFHQEVLMKHEHAEEQESLPVYDTDTDPGKELIVPDPYSMMYVYWLLAKIDQQTLEEDKWDRDMQRFEQSYGTASDMWTRNHMPIRRNRQLWI